MNQLDDWERLSKLDAEVYPKADRLSPSEYVEYLARGNTSWLLTDDKGNWVGNIQAAPDVPKPSDEPREDPSRVPPGAVYASAITVFHGHQRRGLGALLMQKMLAEFGSRVIAARVRSDNLRGRRLLSRFGFHETGIQRKSQSVWVWFERPQREPMT